MTVKSIHRYLSLAFALFWLVQALTGALSVFRWEIDDASVSGPTRAIDYHAVGARIQALQANGASVSSVWASGSAADRFDIHYKVGDIGHVMRVNGDGLPLRDRTEDDSIARGGIFDTITSIHTTLLAGTVGAWIVGISGVLLLSNLILGIKLAWPKKGSWRKTLLRKPAGGAPARLYGWHRKLGFWLALPAMLSVTAGTGLVFIDGIEGSLGAQLETPQVSAPVPAQRTISPGEAMTAALARHPGASLSGIYLPADDAPWYRIRLRVPGEVARKWGTTNVFVGAGDGRMLAEYDASAPNPGRAVIDTLYPLHTGQIGGIAGRILVLAVGLWLIAMVVLGVMLWRARRATVRRD